MLCVEGKLAAGGFAEAWLVTLNGDLVQDGNIRIVKTALPAQRPSQEVFTKVLSAPCAKPQAGHGEGWQLDGSAMEAA